MQYNYTNRWYWDSTDRRASRLYIIELSGVQFGLKSYSMHGFQNWTSSTQHNFDWILESQDFRMISEQNCTRQSSITTLLHYFESQNSSLQNNFVFSQCWFVKSCCLSYSCDLIDLFFNQALKFNWLLCFSKAVSLTGKKMRFRA